MNQETKRIILDHLNEWLEEEKLNTVDLKTSGHLPVSGRWVDSLRKSVRDKDNKGFNTDKVSELLKVLDLPYFMDGSQLVVKPKGESQSKARRIKSIEEIKKELSEHEGSEIIISIPFDTKTTVHCLHSMVKAADGSHLFCERCEKTLSEITTGETETSEASTECEGHEECEGCEICDESEDANECHECEDGKPHFFGKSFCLNCGTLKPS
jgi:hypothetical protein